MGTRLKRFSALCYAAAFLFAAGHASAAAVAPLFVFGLVQAQICRRADSLATPVALHAFYNLLGAAVLVLAGSAAPAA